MSVRALRVATGLGLAALLVVAGHGQASEASLWQTSVSATPVYQGSADIDHGGDFSRSGIILRGGASRDFGGGSRAGITLNYDYMDYSFSNASAFGTVAPWGVVQRYGIAAPLSYGLGDGWSLGFAPSVDWYRENGANTGDSLIWGATASGVKRFEGGNMVGIGVAAFYRFEETSVFPFLVVNWRLGERWRLSNPLVTGPTGPAGLELDYDFGSGWSAGVGAAYRSLRFRLSDNGPDSNGIGEERGIPVFVRVSRNLGSTMALHFYGGIVAGGKLRVENSSGDLVQEENFDPAPLLGLTFTGRF